MHKTNYIISITILAITFVMGQEFGSTPVKWNDIQLTETKPSFTLLDPDRFNVRQGFSMSMVQTGNFSYSVGTYSNEMTYLLSNNLKLHAGFTYLLPNKMSPLNSLQPIQQQLYYSAGLEYKPTENSFLQLRIQNYPRYYNSTLQPFTPTIEP